MSSLIVKKQEKINAVFKALGEKPSEDSFISLFKEMYPKDWERIKAEYKKETRETKTGKKRPMPNPDTYMRNMYKVAVVKRNKTTED